MIDIWDRMKRTPAGALERKQAMMTVPELVPLFEKQAAHDLEEGDAWVELVHDITKVLPELLDEGENAADAIAHKHESLLKEHKGLADRKQQIAYILALAKGIDRRRRTGH